MRMSETDPGTKTISRGRSYPRRDRTTDRSIDVDVDLDRNTLHVETTEVTVKTLGFDELFLETPDDGVADARLKIVHDPGFGWNGYEIRNGTIFRVNYQAHEDGGGRYLEETPIDRDTFVARIEKHVDDEHIGSGAGDFERNNRPR